MFRSATRSVLKYIHLLGLTGDPVIVFQSYPISYPPTYVYKRWVLSLLKIGPRLGSVDHICNVGRPFWAEPQGRKWRLTRGIR